MVNVFKAKRANFYLAALAVFVLIAISSLFVFLSKNQKTSEKESLRIDLNLDNRELYSNQTLDFTTDIFYSRSCDAILQYEIFRLNNLTIIVDETENAKLSGESSARKSFALGDLPAGDYVLRAKIKCNNKLEISIAKFRILEAWEGRASLEDKKSAEHGITEKSQITPQKTDDLAISEVAALSLQNPKEAEQKCNSLSAENKDKCFSGIAESTKNKEFCAKVQDVSTRDGCYAGLALQGFYDVCDSIINSYQKEACYALKANSQ